MRMPRSLPIGPALGVVAVVALTVVGITASWQWSRTVAADTRRAWVDRGRAEALDLTTQVDRALLQTETQLRALTVWFVASSKVDAEELLEAESFLPGDSLSLTLRNLAYAVRLPRQNRSAFEDRHGVRLTVPDQPGEAAPDSLVHFPVDLPSGSAALLRLGADLVAASAFRPAVLSASRLPDMPVMGPAFMHAGGWSAAFAMATRNAGRDGVLVGLLDLDELFDSTVRLAPPGLSLHLTQEDSSWGVDSGPITILEPQATDEPVAEAFIFRFAHGDARWRLKWDLLASYDGGVDTDAAMIAGVGGSMVSLGIGGVLVLLLCQNAMIRRRVSQRTAELTSALDLAEQGNRAKTRFLAIVGHELRTPLNAIIGFAEVLERRQSSAEARDQAHFVVQGGQHLLRQVNDLLDLARSESGQLELQEEPVDLQAVVDAAVETLAPTAEGKGVTLSVDTRDGVPSLKGDAQRLKQVVVSLTSNALGVVDEGGRIAISMHRDAPSGEVTLTVEDDGPGMVEEEISAALGLFEQVEDPMRRRREGMGIGLPLSKRLVELHGGWLAIRTAPGEGTRVSVHLPAERVLAN